MSKMHIRPRNLRGRVMLAMLAVAVFAGGFLIGSRGQAATVAPGSYEDPLVSQSYLEQFIELTVVELAAGQRLEGGAGTQIVLRSGQARAIGSASGGLCDVTAGKDLVNNERIAANHLLLVPRADGRGILAESKLWVMVRGIYTIK